MGKHESKKYTQSPEPERETPEQPSEVPTEPEKHSAGGGKIAAILLVIVAVLLVTVTIVFVVFWRRTSAVTEDMFRQRQSQVDLALEAAVTPTPKPQKQTGEIIEADFIDSEGNAWNFREDLVTVLIMGIDYMADEAYWDDDFDNSGNADLLALAVLDPTDNEMSLLYIPRDTMANIVEFAPNGDFFRMTYNNICVAHEYGDGGAWSCEITVRAVSDLLAGVPIDRYVAIDYDAIDVIDDLIGGVTVTMDDDYTAFDSSFVEGATVTLTGELLKTFVTDRDHEELDGAFNRGHRQMLFLNAVFQQCKEATAEDITFPLRLYNEGADYVTTDLSINEITTLARLIFKTGFNAADVITLQGEVGVNEVYEEYAGYYPDNEWIEQYLAEYLCEPAE